MKPLPFGSRTYIMGILNVTPDSFSGDGLMNCGELTQCAIEQAHKFMDGGADILDIGGESTRPGSTPVSEEEELSRVLPVIKALRSADIDVLISIDTYKSKVAEAALGAGADWINDGWALRADPKLGKLAAREGVPVILMHNRSKPSNVELNERLGNRYVGTDYKDLIGEVKTELLEAVQRAHQAGIENDRIILDPGIGFGKTVAQNLELIDRLAEIKALGYPVLLGPSRKSFIGYTLDLPPNQRMEGTAATVAIGIAHGADLVRVHDVQAMVRVARMTDAIVRR